MRGDLIHATNATIRAVTHPRSFDKEHAFHDVFCYAPQLQLDQTGIQPTGASWKSSNK